jgi:Winged helix-turn-helix
MLKMPRRSQAELMFDVLAALNTSPLKLTRLMYRVNINAGRLKDILKILRNHDYVTFPTARDKHPLSKNKPRTKKIVHPEYFNRSFELSAKGVEFYRKIAPVMAEFKMMLNVYDAQQYALEAERYSVVLQKGSAMQ